MGNVCARGKNTKNTRHNSASRQPSKGCAFQVFFPPPGALWENTFRARRKFNAAGQRLWETATPSFTIGRAFPPPCTGQGLRTCCPEVACAWKPSSSTSAMETRARTYNRRVMLTQKQGSTTKSRSPGASGYTVQLSIHDRQLDFIGVAA